ncbi:copper resistance CopC/CopD family protein [Niallia taxi]|uniref:copper resistance CopC/CopD family protein n=1 Tax=Niallia taxi TaxID=2499688 RepID=UPI003D2A7D5F
MRKAIRLFLFLFLFCSFLIPKQAAAHAVLTNTNPVADSRLEESPEELTLTFNEAIKAGLTAVKVLNQDKETIAGSEVRLSDDNRQLEVSVPELADGAYLVTYTVVSADGHPISGSYVFLIGNSALPSDIALETNEEGMFQFLVYFTRAAYYFGLLSITGWIFWGIIQQKKHTEALKKKFDFIAFILQQYHLLCLILLIAVQWLMNTTVSGIPLNTGFGVSWFLSLLLSVLGLFLLAKSKWIDFMWIFLMLAAKSFNGHSSSSGQIWAAIPANFLHLMAAAVWVGGLLYIVTYWKKNRVHVKEFLPNFSKWAFFSMIALSLSGTLLTVLFLPALDYLWITPWGILLLVKSSLVCLVLLTAFIIRRRLNRMPAKAWHWVKVDFGLMLLILLVVGGLSYLSPAPANSPLRWEESNQDTEMSLIITPNAPGENHFQVQFKENTVKRAELRFIYQNNEEIAPIQVPLKSLETPGLYEAEGYYLPFDGEWVAEVKMVNQNGEEELFTKSFRLFKAAKTD